MRERCDEANPTTAAASTSTPANWVRFEEGLNRRRDRSQEATPSGYVPLTPVLSTWFSFGQHDGESVRYLMAAARRLDSVNLRLMDVGNVTEALNGDDLPGPAMRSNVLRLIADVESAMIALGRAVDMVRVRP